MQVQVTDVYGQAVIYRSVELSDIIADTAHQVEAADDLALFGEYLVTGTGGALWLLKIDGASHAAY